MEKKKKSEKMLPDNWIEKQRNCCLKNEIMWIEKLPREKKLSCEMSDKREGRERKTENEIREKVAW